MKRVLITGATGFVGTHLLEQLKSEEFEITCAVRTEQNDLFNLKTVVVGDIGPDTDWSHALEGIDCVFHLAARAHVMHETTDDPEALFNHVNWHGTQNLGEMAVKAGVKKFIYLSSIKVNGEKTDKGRAFRETDPPDPQDPYGRSKLKGELALMEICENSDMDYTIIRPPLIYGAGVKANFLTLLGLAQKKLPLPFGSLKNIRNMIYVKNLCDILIKVNQNPQSNNQIYLVRDQEEMSFKNFYRMICDKSGNKAILSPISANILMIIGIIIGKSAQISRLTDSLQVNSQKLTRDIDWQPPYSIETALDETLRWFKGRS